jgi:hypothetical protein
VRLLWSADTEVKTVKSANFRTVLTTHRTWPHILTAIPWKNSSGPLTMYICVRASLPSWIKETFLQKWLSSFLQNLSECKHTRSIPLYAVFRQFYKMSVHKTALICLQVTLRRDHKRTAGVGCRSKGCIGQPEWGRNWLFPSHFLLFSWFILISLYISLISSFFNHCFQLRTY